MKYALVTGASRGLGRAFAEELAKSGYNLFLVSLPGEKLDKVAESVSRRHKVAVHFMEENLADSKAVEKICRKVRKTSARVDILVNNAGFGHPGVFASHKIAEWKKMLRLNIEATTELTHALIPYLKKAQKATIINVSSLSGLFPMPFFGIYAASKGYIYNFSLSLREELKELGISVSVLSPGAVITNSQSIADTRAQGIWGRLSAFAPHKVARYTLKKAQKGKAIIIPGWFNKIIAAATALLPRQTIAKLSGIRWKDVARKYHPAL